VPSYVLGADVEVLGAAGDADAVGDGVLAEDRLPAALEGLAAAPVVLEPPLIEADGRPPPTVTWFWDLKLSNATNPTTVLVTAKITRFMTVLRR
jgi:hypothetical protein